MNNSLIRQRAVRGKDRSARRAGAQPENGYASRIASSLHYADVAPYTMFSDESPISAGILKVTDAYTESLRRWATEAFPVEVALREIKRRATAELDPNVVDELLKIIRCDALCDLSSQVD